MEKPKVCSRHILGGSCSQCASWEAARWVIYLCSKQNPKLQHFALPAAKSLSISGLGSQNSTTVVFPFWTGNLPILTPFYDSLSSDLQPGWVRARRGHQCLSMALPSARQIQGTLPTWSFPHLSPHSHTSSAQPRVAQGRQDENKAQKLWGWCPAPRTKVLASPWLHTGIAALEFSAAFQEFSAAFHDEYWIYSKFSAAFQVASKALQSHTAVPGFPGSHCFKASLAGGKSRALPTSLITISRKAQALDTSATAAINWAEAIKELDYIWQIMRLQNHLSHSMGRLD